MGTGSRNFIGSTDFPFERSGTHLKKNSYVFLAISTPNNILINVLFTQAPIGVCLHGTNIDSRTILVTMYYCG